MSPSEQAVQQARAARSEIVSITTTLYADRDLDRIEDAIATAIDAAVRDALEEAAGEMDALAKDALLDDVDTYKTTVSAYEKAAAIVRERKP